MKHAVLVGLCLALTLAGCTSTRSVFEAPTATPPAPSTAELSHVVQPGETLYHIATTYGVSVEELARFNNIVDPRRIEVGQKIRIPLGGEAPPAAAAAPSPSTPESVAAAIAGWAWPVEGQILSRFGARSSNDWHSGVDIKTPQGAEIRAARDGEVTFAGRQGRYGQLVVLNHGSGLTSWYAHLQEILVQKGANVRRGDAVGRSGATGNASGPHLHFEIRRDGRPLDPLTLLPP